MKRIIPYFIGDINQILKIGVYKIYFLGRNELYIGSSTEGIGHRFRRHISDLRKNKHCNTYLQNLFNKYSDDIRFEMVEIVENKEQCIVKEQYWIDYYDSYNKGINAIPNAGNTLGFKMPNEIVEKRRIKYLQYDLGGNFIKEWESYTELCNAGYAFANRKVEQSSNYSSGGFLWRKKKENYALKIEPYEKATSKKILCYFIDGNFYKEYSSILQASNELNIPTGNISKAIKYKNRAAYGYIFKEYYENYPLIIDSWEKKTGHQKEIIIEDVVSGEIFTFKSARQMDNFGINRSTMQIAYKSKQMVFNSKKLNKTFKIIKYGQD